MVELVERYSKEQGLFRTNDTPDPEFTDTLALDLGDVAPSLAGPKRPQDRIALAEMKQAFHAALTHPIGPHGYGLDEAALPKKGLIKSKEYPNEKITHGAVVLAAITSCTNTSNPSVMLGAGILAKKAVKRGLKVPSYVKTSLPGWF